MNNLEYGGMFLKRKLKDIAFQIWGYDHNNDETHFIDGFSHQQATPPKFIELPTGSPGYKINKQKGKVTLQFHYETGNQLCVIIFHDSTILTEAEVKDLYYLMSLYELEKTIQLKNQELTTMVDSIRSITSSLNLNEVLENIIKHALKVIPAADAGYLMLYDPDTKRLLPKAPVGFTDSIYQFNTKVGESITGTVFEDGKGRIFNSRQALFEGMRANNISDENLHYINLSANFTEGAICVPISIKDERIGVMIIHQWKIKRKLNEQDLNLLQGYAVQAATAIQNAQFHTETKQRLREITILSKQLEEKNSQLQKRQEVHETLMNISLKNKGINQLIDELKKMMKRTVVLFNGLENTFYSPDTSDSPSLSIYEIKTIFSEKRQAVCVNITVDTEKSFYLYPIYNGTLFLGCLIIQMTDILSKSDQITIEQGSSILALELLKRQTITKNYHRKTYEQFQELLACEDSFQLKKLGEEMDLNTSSYWMIAILEIPKSSVDLQYMDIEVDQLVSKINTETLHMEKLIYGFYNKIILLLSLPQSVEANRIREKLQLIRSERESSASPFFCGGLSNVYKGLENMRKCYDEAQKTLTYLTNHNSKEIIQYEDIGLNRLFLHQSAQEIKQFINEALAPLSAYNKKHKELEKTLFTYLELNRSASKTAENLHIHVNTLYQRLKKIEDLLGIDLNDTEDTLKIQLACHLKKSQAAMHSM